MTIETATLDLKREVDPSNRFELAKDVAAFANHVGGAIVVGIPQKNGAAAKAAPLADADAAKYRRAYDEAVRDLCRPKPFFDFEQFVVEDGKVLVVNVDPYEGLIGVRHDERLHGFPKRSGSQTTWLAPDQVPLFMDAHMRRVTLVLEQMPMSSMVHLKIKTHNPGGFETPEWIFNGFNVGENTIAFIQPQGRIPQSLPLDQVQTVWRNGEHWRMIFNPDFSRSF